MDSMSNKIVYWCRPPLHCFKLNFDGASKANPGLGGGGGVIRDHFGNFVAAFSSGYGSCTNMYAEFHALKDGLYLCLDMGLDLNNVMVESDSKVLVDTINSSKCSLWRIRRHWKEMLSMTVKVLCVIHQYREGNGVADCLANEGVRTDARVYYLNQSELPKKARGAILLEKGGLPNLRIKHF